MAIIDKFKNFVHQSPMTRPIQSAKALTPDDTKDLAEATRSLFVGVGGDLKVTLIDDDDNTYVTFKNVLDGATMPLRIKRLWNTSNGASSILGLY